MPASFRTWQSNVRRETWRGCLETNGVAGSPRPARAVWSMASVRDARPNISARCSWIEDTELRDHRAIVFDLDDTLYPYRAFVPSGFRAVRVRMAPERKLQPSAVLRVLRRPLANGQRGRELQALCARLGFPESLVESLADLIREHTPSLRLPRESRQVLEALRASWKVGVLTNGAPHI